MYGDFYVGVMRSWARYSLSCVRAKFMFDF